MSLLTLKDFLKKYSILSNDFIDDFYTIYDFNEYNNDDFIINIDKVTKWLESKKSRIKETLVNTYNKDIDYKISKEKNNSKISKSNKEIILLTPDCFKRICLLSKTKKGEEVRTYFIELEKLINNYKSYIIDGLQSTIKILENNQKTVPTNIKGVIYIIKSPKDIDGIYRSITDAGLKLPDRPRASDLNGKLINCFIKCEADKSGILRGRRQIMLDDSDVHHHRHSKAAVGGVAAAAIGDPAVFVSVDAMHQGPPGGGPVIAIVEVGE